MTTLSQDAVALRAKRYQRDKAKEKYDGYKAETDRLEAELFDRMENEDVGGIKVGANNFVRVATTYGSINDRSAFVAWAETEMPELVETKERKALVNEIVRERIDSGEALPPGTTFYVKQYISQRAS
jgi:hypothetical protein